MRIDNTIKSLQHTLEKLLCDFLLIAFSRFHEFRANEVPDLEDFQIRTFFENESKLVAFDSQAGETTQVFEVDGKGRKDRSDERVQYGKEVIDVSRHVVFAAAKRLPDVYVGQASGFGRRIAHPFEELGNVFAQLVAIQT